MAVGNTPIISQFDQPIGSFLPAVGSRRTTTPAGVDSTCETDRGNRLVLPCQHPMITLRRCGALHRPFSWLLYTLASWQAFVAESLQIWRPSIWPNGKRIPIQRPKTHRCADVHPTPWHELSSAWHSTTGIVHHLLNCVLVAYLNERGDLQKGLFALQYCDDYYKSIGVWSMARYPLGGCVLFALASGCAEADGRPTNNVDRLQQALCGISFLWRVL